MSFNRWGYFSWMMKWHPTWKFGMQLSAAVLIAARGSMLSISLKKFLVLSYDLVFKKTTQNPLDSDEYYEHLIWTICVLFLRTSIFVGLKVPFVWGTFRDMYLHRWWRRWWMDESMIEWRNDWMHEWMNEWMNEWTTVCNINTPLNQQFPKRFPLPTRKTHPFQNSRFDKTLGLPMWWPMAPWWRPVIGAGSAKPVSSTGILSVFQ